MAAYADPNAAGDWMDYLRQLTQNESPNWSAYKQTLSWPSREMMEREPKSAYGAYSSIGGYGGAPSYQTWLNNQMPRYYNQYSTMAASNPTLWFTDYLGSINPQRDYSFTSPYERGERAGLFAPSMRMVT